MPIRCSKLCESSTISISVELLKDSISFDNLTKHVAQSLSDEAVYNRFKDFMKCAVKPFLLLTISELLDSCLCLLKQLKRSFNASIICPPI